MSRLDGNVFIIEHTPDAPCELCGAVTELRPYGPYGENICYTCAQKDPAATYRATIRAMRNAAVVVDASQDIEMLVVDIGKVKREGFKD